MTQSQTSSAGSGIPGNLATALAEAERMLPSRPDFAEERVREILKASPRDPDALRVLGSALREQGKLEEARRELKALTIARPAMAPAHRELGFTLARLKEGRAAIAAVARAYALDPKLSGVWRALGDELIQTGDMQNADEAYLRHVKAADNDPQLRLAEVAMRENRLADAEQSLRNRLEEHPTDVTAMFRLAEIESNRGNYDESEHLLESCLALAPGFTEARNIYAGVLYRDNKTVESLDQARLLVERDPRNAGYRNVLASSLARLGESVEALKCYEDMLKEYPNWPSGWMGYGHTLKTERRLEEAIVAYRKAIALQRGLGEAWWSLANLKTVRFTNADIAEMETQLAREVVGGEDRWHLHFALGKALEDAEQYAESFAHYEKANALRMERIASVPDTPAEDVQRSKAVFTADFFRQRAGAGSKALDPIFIVGLPRSGSTLLEQMLSSHPAIEGTMELHDILLLAGQLGAKTRVGERKTYPESLLTLDEPEFAKIGGEYLARAGAHRRLERPFFTDKMPNNFLHVGLIHLILPNAKIIDARRHPLGCCLSNFKQHFAQGQPFTYDLAGMGRYYRSYVELMAHFDSVLPGRVHRVIYEELVDNPEEEIRRVLAYCGLPFDGACLKFYENERSVLTASSEQVRKPLYRDGIDHWQNYEPWLDPLKDALGSVLDDYPAVPEF